MAKESRSEFTANGMMAQAPTHVWVVGKDFFKPVAKNQRVAKPTKGDNWVLAKEFFKTKK